MKWMKIYMTSKSTVATPLKNVYSLGCGPLAHTVGRTGLDKRCRKSSCGTTTILLSDRFHLVSVCQTDLPWALLFWLLGWWRCGALKYQENNGKAMNDWWQRKAKLWQRTRSKRQQWIQDYRFRPAGIGEHRSWKVYTLWQGKPKMLVVYWFSSQQLKEWPALYPNCSFTFAEVSLLSPDCAALTSLNDGICSRLKPWHTIGPLFSQE